MIFIIVAILLVITIVSGTIYAKLSRDKSKYTEAEKIITRIICVYGIVGIIVCSCVTFNMMSKYLPQRGIISQQIVMYEEENNKIEKSIEAAVLQYEDYEKDTYTNIANKSEDVELLVQFYPQLKSDSLVKEQIKTYRDNTNQIKKLKTKQIELQKYKWWLTCKTS